MGGKTPWLRERIGKQRAVLDVVPHGLYVAAEFRIGEAVGQQVQAFQDGQARPHQGDELLVEDEEFLKTDGFLRRPRFAQAGSEIARANGVDQVPLWVRRSRASRSLSASATCS